MNCPKYRLLATDMDGTLLNSNSKISKRTKEKLLSLQKQGMRIVLASGRATFELEEFVKELELEKYNGCTISANGAKVTIYRDGKTNEIIFPKVALEDLRVMIREAEKRGLFSIVNVKGRYLCNYNFKLSLKRKFARTFYHQLRASKKMRFRTFAYMAKKAKMVEDLANFVFEDTPKVAFRGSPKELRLFHEHMKLLFPGKYNYFYLSEGSLEVTHIDVSKSKALEYVCKEMQIPKEACVVFGDSNNDDEMLEDFPTSVAMANAFEKTKLAAKYLTKSNDEDGIIEFLENGPVI